MKVKMPYKAPVVVRTVHLRPSGALLSGSVVDNTNIRSVGQEVDDYNYDFSNDNDGFNHQWQ